MANESKRPSERQGERQQSRATQSSAMERAGGGERGLATRQYQDPFSLFHSLFERIQRHFFGTSLLNALIPHGAMATVAESFGWRASRCATPATCSS